MPLPSALQGHAAGAEALLAAVSKDPSLLDQAELAFLKDFCENYPPEAPEEGTDDDDDEYLKREKTPFPATPVNAAEAPEDADWSVASTKKGEAQQAGATAKAVDLYTAALEAEAATACLSATTLAKRAEVLLKLERPAAAIKDCDTALTLNPDSCRALKVRGKVRAALGEFVEANLDLSKAQSIDFDPDLAPLCAEVKAKAAETSAKQREKARAAELAAKKKAAAERHRRDQEAQARSAPPPSAGGMGGMPGGMGGMGGMPGVPPGMAGAAAGMMNDPEVMAAMANPKVMAAFQDMMAGGSPDPAKMMQHMQDPDVGPVLQKMIGKFGGGMPGMGGMGGGIPGGMGGFPGGMPGGMGGMGGGFDAGEPDIEELPDLEEVDEVD